VRKTPLSPEKLTRLTQQFEHCKAQLLQLSWITQGSVFETQDHTWRWTRKVKAKTVTVALSAQQAQLFQQAIAQHRNSKRSLKRCGPSARKSSSTPFQDLPAESEQNPPKPPLTSRHS
jgi:hypothetical protein